MAIPKKNASKEATHSFSEGGILFKSRVRELGGKDSMKEKDTGSPSAGLSKGSASGAPLQKAAVSGGASLVLALIAGGAAAALGLALRRKRGGRQVLEAETDTKVLNGEGPAQLQQARSAGQVSHHLKGLSSLNSSLASSERVQILMIEPGTPNNGEAYEYNITPRSSQGVVSLGGPSLMPSPLSQLGNGDDGQAMRKIVHKLRHQLQNRDEKVLEMQAQLAEQEREFEEERARVEDLEAKLGVAGQTRIGLESEIERLTKAASMQVVVAQNGGKEVDQYDLLNLEDEAHRLRQLLKEKERVLLDKGRTEAMLKKQAEEIEGALRALEEQVEAKDRLIAGYEQERLQLNSALADLTAQAAQAAHLNLYSKSSAGDDDLASSRDERDFAEPPNKTGPNWFSPAASPLSPSLPASTPLALGKGEGGANGTPDDQSLLWSHEARPPLPSPSAAGSCNNQTPGPQPADDVEVKNGSALAASQDTPFGSTTPRERLESRFIDDDDDREEDTWQRTSKLPGSALSKEIEHLKSDLKSRYELIAEKRREENRLLSTLETSDRTAQEVRNSMAVHPEDDSDLEHAWEQFAEGMSLMRDNGTPSDASTQILQTRLEQVAIEQCVNQEMHEISRREARISELRTRISSAVRTPSTSEQQNGSGQGSSTAVSPSVGPLGSGGTPGRHSSSGSEATPRRHDSLGQELSQKLAEMEEQKHKSSRDLRQLAASLQQSSPLVADTRKDVFGKPRSDGVPRPLPRQPLYGGTAVNTAGTSQSYATAKGDAEGQENRGPDSSSKQEDSPVPTTRHQRKRSWPGLNGKWEAAENGTGQAEEPWEMDDELVRLTAEFELEAADDPTDVMIGSPASSPENSPNPFHQPQNASLELQLSDEPKNESPQFSDAGDSASRGSPDYRSTPPFDESPEERARRNWEPNLPAISNGSAAWHSPQKAALGSPGQSWAVMSASPSPLKGRLLADTVAQGRDFSPSVVCMGSPVLNPESAPSLSLRVGLNTLHAHDGLDPVPEENCTPIRGRRFPEDSSRYSTPTTATSRRTTKRRDGGPWDSEGDVMLDEMLNGALDDMVRACSTPGSSANPSPAQSMEFRRSREY